MDVPPGGLSRPPPGAPGGRGRSTRCSSPTWPTSATSPGSPGRPACLLVLPDELVLVTDGRYGEQAAEQLAAAGVDARSRSAGADQRGRRRRGRRRGRACTARPRGRARRPGPSSGRYADELVRRASSWWPPPGWSTACAWSRTPARWPASRRAAAVADQALADGAAAAARRAHRGGVRPRARHRDAPPRRRGHLASRPSSASGPNGAKPHHRPSDRRIVEGDLVVLDFGALVDGYRSDMTRTVMVGEPTRHPGRACSRW